MLTTAFYHAQFPRNPVLRATLQFLSQQHWLAQCATCGRPVCVKRGCEPVMRMYDGTYAHPSCGPRFDRNGEHIRRGWGRG